MDAFTTALNAVIPTFILIGLGAFADRLLPHLHLETLSRLSVYFLIPALIFSALARTELTLSSALLLSGAYGLYLIVLGIIALSSSRGLSKEKTGGVIIATLFGNTGNMGLPITLFAYGQAGFERAVVLLVVSLTIMFIVGPAVLTNQGGKFIERLKDALKLPPIWATLAGIAINFLPSGLPLSLDRGIELLGNAAIPVMLLSLGIQMRRGWVWEIGPAALRASIVRLAMGPFVAYAVAKVLELEALDTNVLVLSAAMPTAVTMFVVAVEVGGDYQGLARSVVMTTIGSLVAIMAVLFFFP